MIKPLICLAIIVVATFIPEPWRGPIIFVACIAGIWTTWSGMTRNITFPSLPEEPSLRDKYSVDQTKTNKK